MEEINIELNVGFVCVVVSSCRGGVRLEMSGGFRLVFLLCGLI